MTKVERRKVKKLLDGIVVESTVRDSCRKHGRPREGRAVFQQSRIDRIPEFGRQSDVAHALGVRLPSVQQWCCLKKNPLPFVKQNGRKMLKRDIVIKWLIATRRFRPKPEYQGKKK